MDKLKNDLTIEVENMDEEQPLESPISRKFSRLKTPKTPGTGKSKKSSKYK